MQGRGVGVGVGTVLAALSLGYYSGRRLFCEARALTREALVTTLRPAFARRPALAFVVFRGNDVRLARILAETEEHGPLAIPVDPRDAERCLPGTSVAVHGDLSPGGWVALRFRDEVMWPTGRVEPAPADAGDHA